MLTRAAYFMGRDAKYAASLTGLIQRNAEELVGRVSALLERAGVQHVSVASGWRPPEVNDKTANAAQFSKHLTGEAVDLRDVDRELARWCVANLSVLEDIGLWMEDPRWTPTWVHLQIVPPGSGNRVYRPSSKAPLDPTFPVTWE